MAVAALSRRGLAALAAGLAMTAAASAQTEVNVVAFAPGFAWANLFGPSGTEKTPELLAFEEKEGIVVNMEYADEEVARQKVLLEEAIIRGRYQRGDRLWLRADDGASSEFVLVADATESRASVVRGLGGITPIEPLPQHYTLEALGVTQR